MTDEHILPPTYFFGALASMVMLHFFAPLGHLLDYPLNATGLVPLSIGIILNQAAGRLFDANGTVIKAFETPDTLVTTGIYSVSRNPMYLGMIMILLGVALLLGSASPFIIVPAFAITMDRIYVAAEEKILEARFGNHWKAYNSKVRRWL